MQKTNANPMPPQLELNTHKPDRGPIQRSPHGQLKKYFNDHRFGLKNLRKINEYNHPETRAMSLPKYAGEPSSSAGYKNTNCAQYSGEH